MSDIEKHIGIILRIGVAISIAIILVGLILLIFNNNVEMPTTSDISIEYILCGIPTLNPWSIMLFGILMLIATPILRVAGSIVAFAIDKDFQYVIITSVVIVILLTSIVVAFLLK